MTCVGHGGTLGKEPALCNVVQKGSFRLVCLAAPVSEEILLYSNSISRVNSTL